MARTFQIKRGLKAKLPVLAQGEFAMTTDNGTEALWLGTGSINKKIPLEPTAADVGAVRMTNYSGDMNALTADGHYRLANNTNLHGSAYYGQAIVSRGTVNADTAVPLVFGHGSTYAAFRGGRLVNGEWIWEEWQRLATTNPALLLDGSNAMTGYLKSTLGGSAGGATFAGNNLAAYMEALADMTAGVRRQLILCNPDSALDTSALRIWNEKTGVTQTVLHTGNKSSGSYTGNGSAVSRNIPTGGNGSVVLIWSVSGRALLTPEGGIGGADSSVINLTNGEAGFENGILTLTTAAELLNANGIIYNYQVL